MNLFDRGSFASTSSRTYDEKGYLHCHARVARTGIQKYYGFELGLNDDRKFKLLKLYRPESVVFNEDSLNSYLNADITNDHPGTRVTSENFTRFSKGTVVSKGRRDPDDPRYIQCDLIVKDKDTIKAIEAGKVEISAGYATDLDVTPGVTPAGENYDAILKSIKINHVAIVDKGRAGGAYICDNYFGGKLMEVSIGSVQLALEDSVAAEVKKEFENIQTKLKDNCALLDSKNAEIEKLKAKIDSLNEDLEAAREDAEKLKLSDSDILAMVKRADETRAKARILCGDSFVCDSVVDAEIIRTALNNAFPEMKLEDRSPEYLRAYFDARVETAKNSATSIKNAGKTLADSIKIDDAQQDIDRKRLDAFANAWKSGL